MPESGARAIVSDDGSTIWLTAYTEAGDAVSVVRVFETTGRLN
jgi:hypothetical protein